MPDPLVGKVTPGVRVRVPFGPRREIGVVRWTGRLEEATSVLPARTRPILAVLDEEPVLPRDLLEICDWIADYYVAPIGIVHRAALPPGMLTSASSAGATRTRQVVRITEDLPTLVERESVFGRANRQREAFETLESLGGSAVVAHMEHQLGFGRSLVRGLVERGLVEVVEEDVERDAFFADTPVEPPPATLNAAQDSIVGQLRDRLATAGAHTVLLHGVTGSGKTVVYTHAIEAALAAGRTALVLVPEIGLTPQTVARFRAVFGDAIAVFHSALSAGERHDAWRAVREGRKPVAIGTRSAVFAPLPNLGVVVIDEEHDGSYKQGETPRYHARAVAAMRARKEGALLLLGSATPALESWQNARTGLYELMELGERATPHPLPEVRLIDRRAPKAKETSAAPVLSDELRLGVERRLQENRQSLLLLNRRGYATVAQCLSCGWVATCPACNVSLTWHRRRARLVCHHCRWEEAVPERCPSCTEDSLSFGGVGTEQVERVLEETFPTASIARMDVDTTSGKWSHERILRRVRDGEVDILLGTQMIAKGLDLPGVTLVGVIDADVGLNLPDFRAAERTFQLLSQVAGRAGRGTAAGEVLIQTRRPEHPALVYAARHDYASFAEYEIADRDSPGYPPHCRLANLVVSGEDETAVADAAEVLADWLEAAIASTGSRSLTLLGPAPCPIDRLRGRWRWHLLLKAAEAGRLGALLRYTAENAPIAHPNRLEIDRDPEALL